jgi:hypothetical protein
MRTASGRAAAYWQRDAPRAEMIVATHQNWCFHDCTALRYGIDRSHIMGTRRLFTFAALAHVDIAVIARCARMAVRFLDRRVAMPVGKFVYESFDSLFSFVEDFADSVDEVRNAMDRARSERHTISAHRR